MPFRNYYQFDVASLGLMTAAYDSISKTISRVSWLRKSLPLLPLGSVTLSSLWSKHRAGLNNALPHRFTDSERHHSYALGWLVRGPPPVIRCTMRDPLIMAIWVI
jgi:hypothetical protein